MLLKIGTQKYHITIAFLYLYDQTKEKQLNLFEFIIAPLLYFTITLWRPGLRIGWRDKNILWLREGEVIFNDKFIIKRDVF